MNLTKFKTVDQAFKTTVIVASSCCLIMGIAFTVCFFYLSNKIDAAYTKALVLDTSGQVYDVAAIESAAMRKYEYEIISKHLFRCGTPSMKALMRIT